MEISYWQSRWRKDHTGWHMQKVYPLLKTYWNQLRLEKQATILVPLCGITLDIDWLTQQGHYVIGVDVAEKAIRALKDRHFESFEKKSKGTFNCYISPSLELWHGDFLKLRKEWVPSIDAIYDKAALIALPPEQRARYAAHLQSLRQPHTQILMNTFEYEQQEMSGPPFAVFAEELEQLFGDYFRIDELHSHSLFDELTGFHQRGLQSYLNEKLYLFSPQ